MAVVGRPDPETGEALVACVVVNQGHAITTEQVKGLLKGRLASYQHPQDVLFMDTLPHTATGKVQKPELRKIVTDALQQP